MLTELSTCAYCGIEYEAVRSTSQYCSTKHRIYAKRARDKTLRDYDAAWNAVKELGKLLESPATAVMAAKRLDKVRHLCGGYLPPVTRWWVCAGCGEQTLAFIPKDDYCDCGHEAHWYIKEGTRGSQKRKT